MNPASPLTHPYGYVSTPVGLLSRASEIGVGAPPEGGVFDRVVLTTAPACNSRR